MVRGIQIRRRIKTVRADFVISTKRDFTGMAYAELTVIGEFLAFCVDSTVGNPYNERQKKKGNIL